MKKFLAFMLAVLAALSFSACFRVNIDAPESLSAQATASSEPPVTRVPVTAAPENVPVTDATEPPVAEEPTALPATTQSAPATEFHDDYDLPEYSTAGIFVTDEATGTPEEPSEEKSPIEMSDDELLEYFNKTLNAVKTDKVGFKKSKLTSVLDLKLSNTAANSIVSVVKNALLSDTAEEIEVKKGEDGSGVMSPSGKNTVSTLAKDDINGVKVMKDGDNYVITVSFNGLENPGKDSAYGKIFDFITVDDVLTTYAPKVGATVAREDVQVVFSDCYAEATVSPEGKVVGYKTYVKGIMNMNNATVKKVLTINTDVAVTLASTTEYTNFVY